MCPIANEQPETDGSDRPSFTDKIQVLVLAAVALLLSIKSDYRFPLPEALPEYLFQLFLIPYTMLFISALVLFIWPGKWPSAMGRLGFLNRFSILRLSIAVSIVFEAMALALLVVENARFKVFGYGLDFMLTCLLFLAIFVAQAGLLLYKGLRPAHVLAFAVAAYVGTCLLSIFSFPLNPGRSDMLPLIMSAAGNFLAGNSPYTYYFIPPNHLPLTYLPVLWLSYVPAAFFGFDPRLINLLCIIGSAILIYLAAGNKEKASALLAIFILTPYLQYRHELYLGVLWLCMAVLFYAVVKKRPAVTAFSMAVIAATYQLAWIFIPFFFIFLFRVYGKRSTGKAIAVFLAASAILFIPFAVWSPDYFLDGILHHWAGQRFVATANLSYIVSRLTGWEGLIFVQVAALLTLFLLGLARINSASRLFKFLSVSLAAFILLSPFIDAYFYLIVMLLLIMYALAPEALPDKPFKR